MNPADPDPEESLPFANARELARVVAPRWPAGATTAKVGQRVAAGRLPDRVVGAGSGKTQVTVVEYASMTCSHCARFHTTV